MTDKYNATSQDKLFDEGETDYDEDKYDWQNMPEFVNEKNDAFRKIIVSFADERAVTSFSDLVQQRITDKTKSIWHPAKEKSQSIEMWIDDET